MGSEKLNKKKIRFKWAANSALFRILFLTIILIVPINIITLYMSSRAIVKVENQISSDIENALALNMNQVDFLLDAISYRLYYMGIEDQNFAWLNTKTATPGNDDEYSKQIHAVNVLNSTLTEITNTYTWVDSVFCYFPDKEYFLSNSTSSYGNGRESVISIIKNNDEEKIGRWVVVDNDNNLLFRIMKYGDSYYGAWLNLDNFINEMKVDNSENFIVFADQKGFIISSDEELKKINILEQNQTVQYKGKQYITLSVKSSKGDFYIGEMVTRDTLQKSIPGYIRAMRYVVIFALLAIPFLIWGFVRWMVRPVVALVDGMTAIEKGDLDYRIKEVTKSNEFAMINRNFNEMMDKVLELKINIYEQEIDKQNTRMQYLSQQIQPHFILNAMNIIYSYEPEEYPLIQRMILCLSKYYQFVVNANKPYVRLKDEFEHINNYLEIQKIRYSEKLVYNVEFQKEARNAVIPPLIIQNLAENIIKYALMEEGVVEISLKAIAINDTIKVVLVDNGFGIKDKTLDKIREFQKTGVQQKGLGIGIQNTIERLNLFFNGEAKFSIMRGTDNKGTVVEIIFPFRGEEEVEDEGDYS